MGYHLTLQTGYSLPPVYLYTEACTHVSAHVEKHKLILKSVRTGTSNDGKYSSCSVVKVQSEGELLQDSYMLRRFHWRCDRDVPVDIRCSH